MLEIANQDHRLQAIPAVILRMEAQGKAIATRLSFNLGRLSDNARKAAYAALLHIEMNLTPLKSRLIVLRNLYGFDARHQLWQLFCQVCSCTPPLLLKNPLLPLSLSVLSMK